MTFLKPFGNPEGFFIWVLLPIFGSLKPNHEKTHPSFLFPLSLYFL